MEGVGQFFFYFFFYFFFFLCQMLCLWVLFITQVHLYKGEIIDNRRV